MKNVMLMLALAGAAAPEPVVWGGDHVQMEVTADGARLEFDCAHGTIDEAVHADAQGAFTLKGTFASERSGPERDEARSAAVQATYSGTIEDGTMNLRITLDVPDPPDLTYVLTRGESGHLMKCR